MEDDTRMTAARPGDFAAREPNDDEQGAAEPPDDGLRGGEDEAAGHGGRPEHPILLADRRGIRLWELDGATIQVEAESEEPLRANLRETPSGPNTYREVTLTKLRGSAALWALLGRHYDLTRKSIKLHQLSAIVGRGALLVGSSRGEVAVHHLTLNTLDDRAAFLCTLRTATHDAVHAWLDSLAPDAKERYLRSLPDSEGRLGEGLPSDLRESMAADLADLEIPEAETLAGGDIPEEAPEPGLEVIECEVVAPETRYYPGGDDASGTEDREEAPDLFDLTPETILWLARILGSPSEHELEFPLAMRLKMMRVAERLACGVVTYLLKVGHLTLNSAAVRETFAEEGATFAFEGGELYRYNETRGCYEVATKEFERELAGFAVQLTEELRRLRLVAGGWPAEKAGKALKALPRPRSAEAIIRECRASLYPSWHTGGRMNSDLWSLNVANGLLDLRTQELRKHTPEHLSSVQLPFNFDPLAPCDAWIEYLTAAIPDEATRAFLQEWSGYCLIPTTHFEMALFLFGLGGTGKSTFLKVLRKLVGEANCSAVALEDLGDKFRVGRLRDRLLNVVSEINPSRTLNDARFKAFVSGDPVTGEQKFKNPDEFQPFARFVIAANTLPKVDDPTDAFYRRVALVRFDQKFVDNPNPEAVPRELPRDPRLAEKLDGELAGVLNWALDGLARLLARGKFDVPSALKANVRAFREDQDNAVRFLADVCVFEPSFEVSAAALYGEYVRWCKAHGEKVHASNRFGQIASNHPDVQARKSGSKGRYYRGLRPADAGAVNAIARGGNGVGDGAEED